MEEEEEEEEEEERGAASSGDKSATEGFCFVGNLCVCLSGLNAI
jgi:hypothetical protein